MIGLRSTTPCTWKVPLPKAFGKLKNVVGGLMFSKVIASPLLEGVVQLTVKLATTSPAAIFSFTSTVRGRSSNSAAERNHCRELVPWQDDTKVIPCQCNPKQIYNFLSPLKMMGLEGLHCLGLQCFLASVWGLSLGPPGSPFLLAWSAPHSWFLFGL